MHPFYECTMNFKDHLPRNRALELVDIQTEMGLNLESLEGAMRRIGVTDIEAKKEEILKDTMFVGKLGRTTAIFQDTMNPLPPEFMEEGEEGMEGGGVNSEEGEEEEGGQEEAEKESPTTIEESTGQSAERTVTQRAMRGKGDM